MMGFVDGVIQIGERRDGCGGQGLPLGIGPNGGVISQVLLDHEPWALGCP
jgi:hypothetical protein